MIEGTHLGQVHRLQAERQGPRIALRVRRHGVWRDLSWESYRTHVVAAAAALLDLGLEVGDRVALWGENSDRWLIADVATVTAGGITVPIHANLTPRQVEFQLADAGVRYLFASATSAAELSKTVSGVRSLTALLYFDASKADDGLGWSEFIGRGRRRRHVWEAELCAREACIGPENLATIMYTSGTTGNPKGVMLTHASLLSNTQACLEVCPLPSDATILNWLPLSHIFALRIDHHQALVHGATLCLAESTETVIRDLFEIQPTVLAAVPRFYEKVLASVGSGAHEETALVRLRNLFGNRISWLLSGGAPLARPVAEAYRRAGLTMLEGYGMTETSPVITNSRPDAWRLGSVGLPLPGIDIRIAADGEVVTRGPHVMRGYWNNSEATAQAIRDGWLHTGDLGSIDNDGYLTITGRKKELIVLSNGKKVAPTHIESLLVAQPGIDQAVVCGDGRPFLTALLVPAPCVLAAYGQSECAEPDRRTADSRILYQRLRTEVDQALIELAPWEQVKKFVALLQPLTTAAGELTPSLKVRRQVVSARYARQLEGLYATEPATGNA